MKYIKRIVDDEIALQLKVAGAIQIKGPKWCGKTTSARQVAKSVLELQNPDLQDNYLELASTKPSLLSPRSMNTVSPLIATTVVSTSCPGSYKFFMFISFYIDICFTHNSNNATFCHYGIQLHFSIIIPLPSGKKPFISPHSLNP